MRELSASGCVLAGGGSRRMGRNKAELTLGGKTLLELQLDKLRRLGLRDLMVSGAASPWAEVRSVPDLLPDRGPLGGLYACLRAARQPRCLVTAVDTPLVPASALEALLGAHTGGVTLLCCGGREEPLLGVYDRDLAEAVEPLIRRGGAPVRALLELAPVTRVEFAGPPALLCNCNTPEDFAAAERIFAAACAAEPENRRQP